MEELISSRDGVTIEKEDDRKEMDMDMYLMMMKCGNVGEYRNREEIAMSLPVDGIDITQMTIGNTRQIIERDDMMVRETGIGREVNGDMMTEIEIARVRVTGIEIETEDILTVTAIAIDGDRTGSLHAGVLNRIPSGRSICYAISLNNSSNA